MKNESCSIAYEDSVWDLHIHTCKCSKASSEFKDMPLSKYIDGLVEIFNSHKDLKMISFTDHNQINDEVYREFVYGDRKAISMGTYKDIAENVIIIDSISKRFSACGARIGCILSKNKTVQFYSKLIFEPLLEVNQDYSLEPCLATEYSKTGNTSYIIKLRKNVKWQDGEEFTAKDVQYTIDRLKEGIDSIYTYNLTAISGLEVIDDYTIIY